MFRSRLSLDLSSPNTTVELPKLTTTPTSMKTMSSSITKLNHIHNNSHVHASNISLQSILATTPTTPTPSAGGASGGAVANTNNNPVFSPRYTEFKTYSSTFDGLQALENQTNNLNNSNSINNSNSNLNRGTSVAPVNGTSVQDIPLMRVASLPAITPPQLTGKTNILLN